MAASRPGLSPLPGATTVKTYGALHGYAVCCKLPRTDGQRTKCSIRYRLVPSHCEHAFVHYDPPCAEGTVRFYTASSLMTPERLYGLVQTRHPKVGRPPKLVLWPLPLPANFHPVTLPKQPARLAV